MKNSTTNLSFLMKELDISGIELAHALNVDASLISKWRNNTRPLTLESTYIDKLADYLLQKDGEKPLRYIFIKELLSNFIENNSSISKKEALKLWLVAKYTDHPAYIMQKYYSSRLMKHAIRKKSLIFQGNSGRREAARDFLDTALEHPKDKNIYISIQEDLSWMLDDEHFLDEWIDKLEALLNAGAKIHIVYWIDRPIQELSIIFNRYLPLYLNKNIKTYFFPKYMMPIHRTSIFLLEKELGLLGMQGSSPTNRYTEIYYNEQTLRYYQWVMNSLIENSKPIYSIINFHNLDDLLEIMTTKNIDKNPTSLLIMKIPGFYSIPEDFFDSLLNLGLFSKKEETILRDLYTKSKFLHNPKRHIYSYKYINKALKQEYIEYDDLNMILKRKVKIPHSFFKEHLRSLLKLQKFDNSIEIGLTKEDISANISVVDESYIVLWDSNKSDIICVFNELNLTSAIYYHYEKVWGNIPSIYKDPCFFQKKLGK